jgi:transposase
VDFRKSINGLSEITEQELKLTPFSGAIFIFISKRRDKAKALYWDKSGFAILISLKQIPALFVLGAWRM